MRAQRRTRASGGARQAQVCRHPRERVTPEPSPLPPLLELLPPPPRSAPRRAADPQSAAAPAGGSHGSPRRTVAALHPPLAGRARHASPPAICTHACTRALLTCALSSATSASAAAPGVMGVPLKSASARLPAHASASGLALPAASAAPGDSTEAGAAPSSCSVSRSLLSSPPCSASTALAACCSTPASPFFAFFPALRGTMRRTGEKVVARAPCTPDMPAAAITAHLRAPWPRASGGSAALRLGLRMAGLTALMVRRGASACWIVPIWVASAAYCGWHGQAHVEPGALPDPPPPTHARALSRLCAHLEHMRSLVIVLGHGRNVDAEHHLPPAVQCIPGVARGWRKRKQAGGAPHCCQAMQVRVLAPHLNRCVTLLSR